VDYSASHLLFRTSYMTILFFSYRIWGYCYRVTVPPL